VNDTATGTISPAVREYHADCMARIAGSKCRESFSELFDFYAPRLKSYMLRLGASDIEAEDLAQDVMVTVWRKAEQYDRKLASVSTWIFRVARNRRIDRLRRVTRPELDAEEPMLRPPEIEKPEDTINRVQIEQTVREELAKLPPDQLQLLQAAFYDGLSHSEIAEAYDLPLGTVKSRIRRAFDRLRGVLDNEDISDA